MGGSNIDSVEVEQLTNETWSDIKSESPINQPTIELFP